MNFKDAIALVLCVVAGLLFLAVGLYDPAQKEAATLVPVGLAAFVAGYAIHEFIPAP